MAEHRTSSGRVLSDQDIDRLSVLEVCDRFKDAGYRDATPSPTPGFLQVPIAEAGRIVMALEKDYELVGFVNRIPYDIFMCIVGRGGHDPVRLRRWMIEHEDEIFNSVVGPSIDQVQGWYEQDTGDGT